ncbi:transposase [Peribacillus acanthi]|uniref:transposase n=1 Tax=Peribacillus acanthi TaxID=2171554 RepID=UPI001F0B8D63|nr:transposase [Peribacillus acanthi]
MDLVRKGRLWFPGAKYHITSRGVRRTNLFHDDEDRTTYLSLLEEAMYRYSFRLHTYCLMTNHIHLQMETSNTPPSIIMKLIHTKYAKYFNKKYHHSGHVFEKRYGAEIIDTSEYELDVSKYIHLNPFKANMVKQLEDYRWSSFRVYLLQETSSLIYSKQILSYFPEPQSENYEKYCKSGYLELTSIHPNKSGGV